MVGIEIRYKLDEKLFRHSGARLPMYVISDLLMMSWQAAMMMSWLLVFIDCFTAAAQPWGLCVSTDKIGNGTISINSYRK